MEKPILKILLIGDVGSGKTSLWQTYFQRRNSTTSYTHTVFDNYSTTICNDGQWIDISVFEVCGDNDYAELRKTLYPEVNVVLLCLPYFRDIYNTELQEKAQANKWVLELKKHCKNIPVLVVGTKSDLLHEQRDTTASIFSRKQKPLRYKDIVNVAKKFKYSSAAECSAVSKEGLQNVFQTAIKLGIK